MTSHARIWPLWLRPVTIVLATLAMCAGLVVVSASEAHACGKRYDEECPTTTEDGWKNYYDEETKSFLERPVDSTEMPTVEKWWYKSVDLRPVMGVFCYVVNFFGWGCDAESFLTCENDDGNTGFIFAQYTKVNPAVWATLSEEERSSPPYEGFEDWAAADPAVFCNAPSDRVTLDEIRRRAQDIWEEEVEFPTHTVNPAPRALVQAPVILSAEKSDEPVRHEIEEPLPGVLEATPRYVWKADGEKVAEGAGRKYDGTDPLENPDHYVHHVFEESGDHTITLEVHWEATVTVGNNDPVQLEDLVLTETVDVEVVESRARLSDGGGS